MSTEILMPALSPTMEFGTLAKWHVKEGDTVAIGDIIAEIASASQEQASGIDQINKAVVQMDEMTQQNAALVEEAAAASQSMLDKSQVLKEQVSFFRIDNTVGSSVLPTPAHERRGVDRPFSGSTQTQPAPSAAPKQEKVAPMKKTGTDDEWNEF